MKSKFLLFVLIATIFTSCVMQKINTSKTMDIYGAGVIQNPVVVDLDVKEAKVTGTATAPSGQIGQIEIIKSMAVTDALKTSNADVIEAKHLCMLMRGVQKQNSVATTSAFTGEFLENQKTREEFVHLISTKLF